MLLRALVFFVGAFPPASSAVAPAATFFISFKANDDDVEENKAEDARDDDVCHRGLFFLELGGGAQELEEDECHDGAGEDLA